MLYFYIVIADEYPIVIENLDDYLFGKKDIENIFEQVNILKSHLSDKQLDVLNEWIMKNKLFTADLL